MAGMMQYAGMSRYLLIGAYLLIFFEIVFAIIAAGVVLFKTGDWHPLLEVVGGRAFGADKQLGEDVATLIDPNAAAEFPELYGEKYAEFLRTDIIRQVMVLLFMGWLLYKVANWFMNMAFPQNKDNPWMTVGSLGIGILALGALQWLYVLLVQGEMIIPYKGVALLLWNITKIWVIPEVGAADVATELAV